MATHLSWARRVLLVPEELGPGEAQVETIEAKIPVSCFGSGGSFVFFLLMNSSK